MIAILSMVSEYNFEDGWGLVRSSNTQPVIVCRFEAKTQSAEMK